MESNSVTIAVPYGFDMPTLLGESDCNLRVIEDSFDAKVTIRGDQITVSGEDLEVKTVVALFFDLMKVVESGEPLTIPAIKRAIDLMRNGEFTSSVLREDVLLTYRGRAIRPKTAGQKHYTDAIRDNTITFAIGPAGTGKTYLAMAMAVKALKSKEVDRLILTRPVVEAGENLGFLPGTLTEKVDPYIRPLYDALFDMNDMEKGNKLIEQGIIEIAPLAYMRGRTLNNSFIILDEAQNTTPDQMKMFLTRLGFGSKMVITGDITQLDLPREKSGLLKVRDILEGVEDIAFCDLTGKDVVRHSLVQRIVAAYEEAEERKK